MGTDIHDVSAETTPVIGTISPPVPISAVELKLQEPVLVPTDLVTTLNLPAVLPVYAADPHENTRHHRHRHHRMFFRHENMTPHRRPQGMWDGTLPQGLDPSFSLRLEKILNQMNSEGYAFYIGSGVRDQKRQEEIRRDYRRRGIHTPVARLSAHRVGGAADIIGHGFGFYHRLHQLAKQEGLAPAVPRDPCHIALPVQEVALLYGKKLGSDMEKAFRAIAFHQGNRSHRPNHGDMRLAFSPSRHHPAPA